MNKTELLRKCTRYLILLLAVVCLIMSSAPALAAGDELVEWITSLPGVRPGLAIHLGTVDGAVELALHQKGYLAHGITSKEADMLQARTAIQAKGTYGPVSVDLTSTDRLPYAAGIVNLLIAEDWKSQGFSPDEVVRVLAPYGSAFLKGGPKKAEGVKVSSLKDGWVRIEKPYPEGAAEFPYSGSKHSDDMLVAPPTTLKWIAGDRWPAMDAASYTDIASEGGITFYCFNYNTGDGFKYKEKMNNIVARDAFNGKLLWNRIVPHVGKNKRISIKDGVLHVGYPQKYFAAATGKELTKEELPKSNDPYAKAIKINGNWVFPRERFPYAVDPKTKKTLWKSKISAYSHLVGGDKVFRSYKDKKDNNKYKLTCLDLTNGKELWTIAHKGSHVAYADDVVFTRIYRRDPKGKAAFGGVCGYSTADGKLLWEYEYTLPGHGGLPDIWVKDGLAWVHAAKPGLPTSKGESWRGLDPKSGKVVKTIPMDDKVKHRCSPHMMSGRFILANGMDLFDTKAGKVFGFYGVRNTCSYGFMPANGMLYSSYTVCECFPHMRGITATKAEQVFSWQDRKKRAGQDFVKGPAFGKKGKLRTKETDWPIYRHDPFRSGATKALVPTRLKTLWTAEFGKRISQPTVVGGLAFVSVIDEHRVVAIDIASGKNRWDYTVGGRVDTPPTIHKGLALFGSRDGWVYCLNADSGKLAWKFRAAPEDMRIVSREQLESSWALYGTVLVQGGVAYVSAGRHSEVDGGIFLYALNPASGKVKWSKQIERPNIHQQASGRNVNNEMNDILAGRDDVIFMHWKAFKAADGSPTEMKGPRIDGGRPGWIADMARPPLGWKHDFQLKRGYVPPGDTRRRGIGTIFSVMDNQLFVLNKATHEVTRSKSYSKHVWKVKVPDAYLLKSLAVTPETVFVGGMVDGTDPTKGELMMYSVEKGESLGTVKLPAAPAFEGMAAVAGRLFICTQDGKLLCMGK